MVNKVKYTWKGDAALLKLRQAAVRGCERTNAAWVKECIRLVMSTPKSGRMYGSHQASAPGEPPAHWRGELIKGYRTKVQTRKDGVKAIGTNVSQHIKKLEQGTRKMRPRPHLARGLIGIKDQINAIFAEEFRKVDK